MTFTENQVKDIIASTLTKAWEDENFKQELLLSPIDAIESLTGARLNFREGFKMTNIDHTNPITLDLSITSMPEMEDIELTEEELEFVTGGGRGDEKSQADFICFIKSYL